MILTLAVTSGCYLKSIADSMACRWFEIWFTHGEVGDQRAQSHIFVQISSSETTKAESSLRGVS